MHVSPAKHSSGGVTDGRTDRRTDRQTDDGQSDPYVSLCFAGDTKSKSLECFVVKYINALDLHAKKIIVKCYAPSSKTSSTLNLFQ